MKEKKNFKKILFTAIRDIVSIFLAFTVTDYITEKFKIKSSFYDFLIYFGFLLIVTVIGMSLQVIIKKCKKNIHKKDDFQNGNQLN